MSVERAAAEDSKPEGRNRVLWTVAALFVLGAGIRLFHLATWSLWADEVATLQDMVKLGNVKGYPVGYALIGLTVKLLGGEPTEFAARLLPAVAGALTVPVIYLIGRRLFTDRAGLFAAVFLALSCYHIFFSQFARYYTLVMLFGLLGMWAAYCGIERDKKAWLAAAVLLLGLAFLTHWSAALLLPALVVYALWAARGEERPVGLTLLNMLILFGPFVVGGLIVLPHVAEFVGKWQGGADFSAWRALLVALKLAYRLEAAGLICAGVGAWVMVRAGDRRGKWLIAFLVAPLVLLVGFVAFSRGGSRFGIVVLPAAILLAAATLDALLRGVVESRRKLAWTVVGLVLISLLIKDVRYFTVEQGQRPRWREAAGSLMRRCVAHDGVYITNAGKIVAHYGETERQAMAKWNPETFRRILDEDPQPVYFVFEHVRNVSPEPWVWSAMWERGVLIEHWPLRVGALDYSISLYGNRSALRAEEAGH